VFQRTFAGGWLNSAVAQDGKQRWRSPGSSRNPRRPGRGKYRKGGTEAALDCRVGPAVLGLGYQDPGQTPGLKGNDAQKHTRAQQDGKSPAAEAVVHSFMLPV